MLKFNQAVHALYPDANAIPKYVDWFRKKTLELLSEKSYRYEVQLFCDDLFLTACSYEGVSGKHVDIVRDVIDLLGVHWAADQLVRDKAHTPVLFHC